MNTSKIEAGQPEQKPNIEQQNSIIPSPPAIGNTNVSGSLFGVIGTFRGELKIDGDKYFKRKDVIETLNKFEKFSHLYPNNRVECPFCGKKHNKIVSLNETCIECSEYFGS